MSSSRRNGMKTQIAVMRTEQKNMLKILEEIKENTKDMPVMRTDLKWLKFWHNKIVIGVILAIIVGGAALIFQVK